MGLDFQKVIGIYVSNRKGNISEFNLDYIRVIVKDSMELAFIVQNEKEDRTEVMIEDSNQIVTFRNLAINFEGNQHQHIKPVLKPKSTNVIQKDEVGRVIPFPKKDSYLIINNKSISSINKTSQGSLEEKNSLINQSTASKEFTNDEVRLSNQQVGYSCFEDELEYKSEVIVGPTQQIKSIPFIKDIGEDQLFDDSIKEDYDSSDNEDDDLDNSQGSLTHNIWQKGDDDLVVRGVDIENWMDKQGNPFNIFNLYKARSGQFKTYRENLANQTVCKNIERLYNSYSKERPIGESTLAIDFINNKLMGDTQMKASNSPKKKNVPMSFQQYLILNPFKDSNDYTKSGYNNIIFDRFKEYYAKYKANQSRKYNFSPERIRKPLQFSSPVLPSNIEELNTQATHQSQQKFIRSKTKKLTVDIFNSPESKPTLQALAQNENSFKLNTLNDSQQKCYSSHDLDRDSEVIEQDKQSSNNSKINKFQILRPQQSLPYKSHNILPLQQVAAQKNQTLINKISQEYNLQQIQKNSTQNQICEVVGDTPQPQNTTTSNKASYFDGLPLNTLKSKLESMQKLVSNQKNRQIQDKSQKSELQKNNNQHFEEILAPLKEELKPYQFHQEQGQLTRPQIKKQQLNTFKKIGSQEEILDRSQMMQQQNTSKETKINSTIIQSNLEEYKVKNDSKTTTIHPTCTINQTNEKSSLSPDRKSIKLQMCPTTAPLSAKINELQKIQNQKLIVNTDLKNSTEEKQDEKNTSHSPSKESPLRKYHRKLFTEQINNANSTLSQSNNNITNLSEKQQTPIQLDRFSSSKQEDSPKKKGISSNQENQLQQLHRKIFSEQRIRNVITTTPVNNQNTSQNNSKSIILQSNAKDTSHNKIDQLQQDISNHTHNENLIKQSLSRKVSQEDKFITKHPQSPKLPIKPSQTQEGFSNYYHNYIKKEDPKEQTKQIQNTSTPNVSNDLTPLANTSTQDQSPLFFLNKNKRQISTSNNQSLRLFQRMYKGGMSQNEISLTKNDESQDQNNNSRLHQQSTTQENVITKSTLNQHINKYYIPVKTDQSRASLLDKSKNILSFSSISNPMLGNKLRIKQVNMSPTSFQQRSSESFERINPILNATQRLACQSPTSNANELSDFKITQKFQSDEKSDIINLTDQQISPLKKRAVKYERIQNSSALKPFINSLFPNNKIEGVATHQNNNNNNNNSSSITNSSIREINKNSQTYYFSNGSMGQNSSILNNSNRHLSQIDMRQLINESKSNVQNNSLLKKCGFQPIKADQIQSSQKKNISQPHKNIQENDEQEEEEIFISEKQRPSNFNI